MSIILAHGAPQSLPHGRRKTLEPCSREGKGKGKEWAKIRLWNPVSLRVVEVQMQLMSWPCLWACENKRTTTMIAGSILKFKAQPWLGCQGVLVPISSTVHTHTNNRAYQDDSTPQHTHTTLTPCESLEQKVSRTKHPATLGKPCTVNSTCICLPCLQGWGFLCELLSALNWYLCIFIYI